MFLRGLDHFLPGYRAHSYFVRYSTPVLIENFIYLKLSGN